MRQRILGSWAICGMSAVSAAMAQTAVKPDALSPIREVLVTAQRRPEKLQDVPITVTAISAARLAASGVTSTQDLASVVPGLTFPSSQGFALPHLRGIGTTAVEGGVENSVSLYVDGVYYASPAGSILSLNSVSDIQVLKGPQGTLFGRNSTGGLIQVTTKDPSANFGGNAGVTYGNYNTGVFDGYLTGGVASNLAADIAVHASGQQDGYGKNYASGKWTYQTPRNLSLRSKWMWTPTNDLKVRIALDYENTLTIVPLQPIPGDEGLDTFYPGKADLITTSGRNINQATNATKFIEAGGGSLLIDQDLGFAHVTNAAAYRDGRYYSLLQPDLGPIDYENTVTHQSDTQFSDELQLQSPANTRLQWTLGLYYLHLNDALDPFAANFSGTATPFDGSGFEVTGLDNATQITDSVAGYAQGTYALRPDTHMTMGFRYTAENKSLNATTDTFNASRPGGPITGSMLAAFSTSSKVEKPTYRVALDHRFSRDIMAYVSWNQSFKSGGYNLSAPSDTVAFHPETLSAYEAGLKTDWFNRRLQLDGSGFYYNYNNVQVVQFVNGSPEVYNGGKAEIYGLDVDATIRPTDSLRFSGGLEALHDEFTSFPCAQYEFLPSGIGGVNQPASVCPIQPRSPTFVESATGHQLPDTPRFTGNLTAEYTASAFGGVADFTADAVYNSGYFSDPNNQLHQAAFTVVNASARWDSPGDRYYVTLWGKNIFNEMYSYQLSVSAHSFAESFAPPATYGVTVGTRF